MISSSSLKVSANGGDGFGYDVDEKIFIPALNFINIELKFSTLWGSKKYAE